MKQLIIVLAFALAAPSLVAQRTSLGKLSLLAGGNLSALHFTNSEQDGIDYAEGLSPRLGFQAGVLATPVRFGNKFGLATGLLYVQKGFEFDTEWPANLFRDPGKVRYHYLSLPLALRWHTTEGLFVEAGGYMAYLLEESNELGGEEMQFILFPADDWDYGLNLGIGYQFHSRLSIYLRYAHGLQDVLGEVMFTDENGEPLLPADGQSRQLRSLQLSLVVDLLEW